MKKILSIFLALVAVLSLVSCKKDPEPRTYVADGKYTAFVAHDNSGSPQLTWVTVTIENDEIKSFYIDQLQGAKDAWKEKTKKELGFGYRMHGQWGLSEDEYIEYLDENDLLEWHEQADLIEKHFLTTLDVTTDSKGKIQGISGVTIADNQYIALAKQAVENAKAGIVNTFVANTYSGLVNLTSAQAKINAEGKITEVKIDELQSAVAEEVWNWKTQTKQQLGFAYRMHGQWTLSEEEYKTYLTENEKLEWFQQVDALAAAWLGGANVSDIKTVSGVSIADSGYSAVLAALLSEGWTR